MTAAGMLFPEGGSMQSKTRAIVVMILIMGFIAGCSTGSVTKDEGDALMKSAQASRQEWNKIDPQFEAFAKKGYAFIRIHRGGVGAKVNLVAFESVHCR